MIIDGHKLPCYFADGFCKPTTKTLNALVWFIDDFCVTFTLQVFVGRLTKKDRKWVETDYFVDSSISNKTDLSHGIEGARFPHVHAPHSQNQHNPSLSRFEILPHAQTFCSKPEPLHAKQYCDLFVTYTNGFNIHTGQPHPQSVINEKKSGKIN